MAGIQTGIQLNDQFSSVLNNIINSVNLAVAAMDDMQQSMNANIDANSLQGAREEIIQAGAAMNELNDTMDQMASRQISPDIVIPDTNPVEIPVTWQTDSIDVFTGTGVERFQQEVQSTNSMLSTLNTTQARISQTAQGMDILPDAAVQDMNTMQQRLSTIQQRIQ